MAKKSKKSKKSSKKGSASTGTSSSGTSVPSSTTTATATKNKLNPFYIEQPKRHSGGSYQNSNAATWDGDWDEEWAGDEDEHAEQAGLLGPRSDDFGSLPTRRSNRSSPPRSFFCTGTIRALGWAFALMSLLFWVLLSVGGRDGSKTASASESISEFPHSIGPVIVTPPVASNTTNDDGEGKQYPDDNDDPTDTADKDPMNGTADDAVTPNDKGDSASTLTTTSTTSSSTPTVRPTVTATASPVATPLAATSSNNSSLPVTSVANEANQTSIPPASRNKTTADP